MKPTPLQYQTAVLESLSQITSPNHEQEYLIQYIKDQLEQPLNRWNKSNIQSCLGRIWMLIK